ncbi:MAG: tetratricopeptide repeat protein [Pyrinomonadaceae bacterium]|nr:tetratricopeptide repeat protein [Pyrinomonadaceae bacterium]
MKTLIKNPKLLVNSLFHLERAGKYQKAFDEVSQFWTDTSKSPELDSLEPADEAELLLRCGALAGFLGYNNELKNAQDKSRNLLTKARDKFINLEKTDKIAECENYMALAYWRTGELEEAEAWIAEALGRDVAPHSYVRAQTYIVESKVVFAKGNFEALSEKFRRIEPLIIRLGDDGILGDFYNHFGLAAKNLGDKVLARVYLELAAHHHRLSGHRMFYGTVRNNLAQLLRSENDFDGAHQMIDSAAAVFAEIGDNVREGFSLDTKANIYFDQGNYDDALATVERSLKILESCENAAYVVETLMTKTRIILAKDDFYNATLTLFEAVQIAKKNISEEAARKIVKQFEDEIGRNISAPSNRTSEYSEAIELALPASLAHYDKYEIVRIRNSHLEAVGIVKGSLAVVVDEEVSRGDLAAIMKIDDGSIYCGFFDLDFGIICLEGIDSEPQLHDADEIKILGKIVGHCSGEIDRDGKLIVRTV